MAVTRTARGSITSKASGTTLTIASQTIPVRSLLVVYLAYDDQTLNGVTAGGTPMELGDAVIGAGVRTRMAWLYTAAGFTGTIVATWAGALVAKAMAADSFVSSNTGLIPYADQNATNTGQGTAASTAATAAIVGGTEAIRVGVVGTEGPSGDTAGTWAEPGTGGLRVGTTGNPAAGNVTVSGAYRLAPAAGSTTGLSKTGMNSRDWGAGIRSFYWAAPPTGITASAAFEQAPAGWAASASEEIPGSAAFEQVAATWAATVDHSIPAVDASAEFTQAPATWSASATHIEPVTGIVSFEQVAATWSASATNTPPPISATASWTQAAPTWAATLDHIPPPVSAEASFAQAAASWAAVLDHAEDTSVSATAAFEQAAGSWQAGVTEELVASATFEQIAPTWGALGTSVVEVAVSGAWAQVPATWSAVFSVENPPEVAKVLSTPASGLEAAAPDPLLSKDAGSATLVEPPEPDPLLGKVQ